MKKDLRSKLNLKEKPILVIGEGVEITVNNDAMALLDAMEIINGKEDIGKEQITAVINILYSAEDIQKIRDLHLSVDDLMTVLTESINTAQGADEDEEKNA